MARDMSYLKDKPIAILGCGGVGKTIRLWRMLVLCPAWIVYNLMVGSWPGIALELIAMASVAVSFWRYGFAALDA